MKLPPSPKNWFLPTLLLMWLACSKPTVIIEPDPTVATLTTTAISAINHTDAQGGGNITSDGGSIITARGVCWSTTAGPTITDSKTTDDRGTGTFTSYISGLTASTTYYIRAYATNNIGTAYGNEISFTTEEEPVMVMAELTTTDVTVITPTTAKSGGNITVGATTITAQGICWSTLPNPTISDNSTFYITGAETFTSFCTSLEPGTTYYVRAYAINEAGTAYGNEVSFTTLPEVANKVYDIDGNVYNTVTIGTQVWMMENLKTTRYQSGDEIPTGFNGDTWGLNESGAYAIYADNISNDAVYGKLYNWYAVVDSRKISPEGWHVPTADEWQILIEFLGGLAYAGDAIKEAGTTHWMSAGAATNSSGFTGLPGGIRGSCTDCGEYNGEYNYIGRAAYWWTDTESSPGSAYVETRALYDGDGAVNAISVGKGNGLSVRCVKDW